MKNEKDDQILVQTIRFDGKKRWFSIGKKREKKKKKRDYDSRFQLTKRKVIWGNNYLTGKLMRVPGPQYFKAARSYALAAASSSSYAPVNNVLSLLIDAKYHNWTRNSYERRNKTELKKCNNIPK